jgi:hypothetical protein
MRRAADCSSTASNALAVERGESTQRAFGLRAQMLAARAQLEASIGQLSHDPEIR